MTCLLSRLKKKKYVSQEYNYWWQKMGLLRQSLMQKAVDWQGWISVALPKGGVSWKKNDAVYLVGSLWYYSFWVFNHYQTLNADLYSQQFQCVHENLLTKCPTLINRQDIMQEKILDLGWSVLPHPPYSPDLASSDFNLFHSLWNALNDKKFSQENHVKTFGKTFWAQNQLNLTWEESTSYLIDGKKWRKMLGNILLIEINSLFNDSWINYVLRKQKLSTQYISVWIYRICSCRSQILKI